MDSFAVTAVSATFSVFGEEAVYENPAKTSSNDIVVIPKRPDDVVDAFGSAVHTSTAMFEVQVSDLPAPEKDGFIVFQSTRYVIQAKPFYKDDKRLVWRLNTYPE